MNTSDQYPDSPFEVVEHGVGQPGYRDAATYDQRRFGNPASNYRQTLMMDAISRLVRPLDRDNFLKFDLSATTVSMQALRVNA